VDGRLLTLRRMARSKGGEVNCTGETANRGSRHGSMPIVGENAKKPFQFGKIGA